MTMSNLLVGLVIGLPIMIATGPISILLLDQGLERGLRGAAPAVFGVASADLTFSVLAAVAGASAVNLLTPISGWLTAVAVAVLLWLALDLGRSALGDLRGAVASPAFAAAGPVPDPVDDAGASALAMSAASPRRGPGEQGVASEARPALPVGVGQGASPATPFARIEGTRLAAAFYGLTMVNPLTIVLFSSVVIAGGAGVGTAGWALGMALASFVAHGAYAVTGAVLGARLSPRATAVLRGAAAAFMAGLALHFLVS